MFATGIAEVFALDQVAQAVRAASRSGRGEFGFIEGGWVMRFETLSIVLAAAGLLLALGWQFAGALMLKRWRLEPNPVALLVGRRISVVYFSVALLFFWTRATTSPDVVYVLSAFAAVANGLLAALGTSEFLRGRMGPGIFVSVVVEIFLAVGFGRLVLA
jgi:hypothetical protein